MRPDSPHDTIAEQAAQWIVLLTADDAAEREQARQGFDAWKRADPRHASAAAGMEGLLGQLQSVRDGAGGHAQPARARLDAAGLRSRRSTSARRAGAMLAVAAALAVPAWLALGAWPPAVLTADLRTGSSQWDSRTLSDGTHITLNSASAANLRYDAGQRTIELLRGEILVEVARDATRPFVVETAHGRIQALGTRFVVDRRDDATVLTMLESRTTVQAAALRGARSPEATVVDAGQRVRITADGVGAPGTIDPHSVSDAWRSHQLVVSDQPLAEVLDALQRHRPGRILYARDEIAGIRVTAVLPLDDTDRALQLLLDNFQALRVRMLTPYLVWVDAPPPS